MVSLELSWSDCVFHFFQESVNFLSYEAVTASFSNMANMSDNKNGMSLQICETQKEVFEKHPCFCLPSKSTDTDCACHSKLRSIKSW